MTDQYSEISKHLKHLTTHAQTGSVGQMENTSTIAHVGLISIDLITQIKTLNSTITLLNKENRKLEETNSRLQWVMLILTIVMAILAMLTFIYGVK